MRCLALEAAFMTQHDKAILFIVSDFSVVLMAVKAN